MKGHRQGAKQQKVLSRISGGWKAKIKALAGSVSGENCPLGLRMATFSWCPCVAVSLPFFKDIGHTGVVLHANEP